MHAVILDRDLRVHACRRARSRIAPTRCSLSCSSSSAAGWPATLLSGGNELGRGLAILAVALALLAGMTERPSRLALIATGAVIGCALALSSSPAVAKSAFLDWQHWDFYTQPTKAGERQLHLGRALRRSAFPEEEDDGAHDPRAASGRTTGARPCSIASTERAGSSTCGQRNSNSSAGAEPPAARDDCEPRPSGGDRRRARGQPRDRREHADLERSPVTARPTRGRVCSRSSIGGLQRGEHYASQLRATADAGGARARPGGLSKGAHPAASSELDVAPGVTALPFGMPGRDGTLCRAT